MTFSARHKHVLSLSGIAGLCLLAVACAQQSTDDETPPPIEPDRAVENMPREMPKIEREPAPTGIEMAEPRALTEAASDYASGQQIGRRPPVAPIADSMGRLRRPDRPVDRENYAQYDDNPIHRVSEQPVSTFSVDVDTGSYANVRRMLRSGRLPPEDAVRVEEMINYFDYDYPAPEKGDVPFNVNVEQAVTPWNPETRLVQIGIKGYEPPEDEVPSANLVFLIDISGSMNAENKLPLLKNALKMLARQLDGDDRVAMVVYAGATGVVLESTPGDETVKITTALDRLSAGGRTNGAAGIELAYAQARQGFIADGINRVILATDGDFNVGTVNFEALKDLAERKRETGVSLTTLGFGGGNYNDHLMEQLADAGNGNYAYIDTLSEARKVLVDEMGSTLQTIAKDVKIQVEFNPAVVAEYRLIGYENRVLEREDFNNDKVDAGEIGAGHTVTALYEVALVGSDGQRVDPLRYGNDTASNEPVAEELGFLRLRYKAPDGDTSKLIERPIDNRVDGQAPERLRFAAAVAAFGQHLRGGKYLEDFGLDAIHELAARAKGADTFGYRGEFLQLVRLAEGFGEVALADDERED